MKRRSLPTFDAFCREAVDFLTGTSTPYLIIGGLAVAVIGEPRMTGDVDVIGYLSVEQAMALIDAAVAANFEVAPDERERLHATGTLRFSKGRFHLDIILASLPFEDDARARARKRRLFGRLVLLPTPEDLILLKVLAGWDKDLVDAVGIARRHLCTRPSLPRREAQCRLRTRRGSRASQAPGRSVTQGFGPSRQTLKRFDACWAGGWLSRGTCAATIAAAA